MRYSDFIDILKENAEIDFAHFQRKLIFTNRKILGVRTPMLRQIAKKYKGDIEELFSYPDEYYETVFIKLTVTSHLPYDVFIRWLPNCVKLIDTWALCDCFKCKTIANHKQEFLPILENLFLHGSEFYERYVLVMLLSYYVDEPYISCIKDYILRANTCYYYVHMAVAWLIAEVLIKHYYQGIELLNAIQSDVKTHNKAIQKAIESFRLTKEQKDFLRSLKIK